MGEGDQKSGPSKSQTSTRSSGRAQPRQRPAGGRYTAPVPKAVKKSPVWMGPLILAILVLGGITIILNYVQVLPYSPTNWYLLGGIADIAVGFGVATRYR